MFFRLFFCVWARKIVSNEKNPSSCSAALQTSMKWSNSVIGKNHLPRQRLAGVEKPRNGNGNNDGNGNSDGNGNGSDSRTWQLWSEKAYKWKQTQTCRCKEQCCRRLTYLLYCRNFIAVKLLNGQEHQTLRIFGSYDRVARSPDEVRGPLCNFGHDNLHTSASIQWGQQVLC